MKVFAVVTGPKIEVLQVSRAEFERLRKGHETLRGIPAYWTDCGLGYQVWPLPLPDGAVRLCEQDGAGAWAGSPS